MVFFSHNEREGIALFLFSGILVSREASNTNEACEANKGHNMITIAVLIFACLYLIEVFGL